MGIGMLPVGVAGVIGLCGGGVWPTEGRAEGGTNSLALGFRTNSFAFGLSLDLVTLKLKKNGNGSQKNATKNFFREIKLYLIYRYM